MLMFLFCSCSAHGDTEAIYRQAYDTKVNQGVVTGRTASTGGDSEKEPFISSLSAADQKIAIKRPQATHPLPQRTRIFCALEKRWQHYRWFVILGLAKNQLELTLIGGALQASNEWRRIIDWKRPNQNWDRESQQQK